MSLPTQLTTVKNVWKMTLYVTDCQSQRGFSESFCVGVSKTLPSTQGVSGVTALTTFPILTFRPCVLGAGPQIMWARLSNTSYGAKGVALLNSPVAGIPYTGESPLEEIAQLGDGAMFRFQTASSLIHGNRSILGLRDSEVDGETFVPTITGGSYTGFTPATGPTGLAQGVAWDNLLYAILTSSCRASFKNGKYTVEPWSTVNLRKVQTKHLGSPFGSQPGRRRS